VVSIIGKCEEILFNVLVSQWSDPRMGVIRDDLIVFMSFNHST